MEDQKQCLGNPSRTGLNLAEINDDDLKSRIEQYYEENLVGEFSDADLEYVKEIIRDFVKHYLYD